MRGRPVRSIVFALKLGMGALATAWLGTAYGDHAGQDEERSLTMTCDYADYKQFQLESASISQTALDQGEPAAIKTFVRGATPQRVTFRVGIGMAAECVYPSGNRVRVKVGEGVARAYGMCGGDPQVFASVWVNKRKVLSRFWFAGHCREDSDNSLFSLQVGAAKVTQCQTARSAAEATGSVADSAATRVQPPAACVEYPEVKRFRLDSVEYPSSAARRPEVGTVEVLRGGHPVCREAVHQLESELRGRAALESGALDRFVWGEGGADLPAELVGGTESVFDFNNDGALDRAIRREFEHTYMHGSVLLVQPGRARDEFRASGPLLGGKSILAACQMGSTPYAISSCPPLSQAADESGFLVPSRRGERPVYFRARYSEVSPFRYRGATYVDVRSRSEDSREFFAVLKPSPNGHFRPLCLLRQVPENF